MQETIYAFIDSQNLNLAIKNDIRDRDGNLLYQGWALDFGKFHELLKKKYRADKIFLFIGYKAGNEHLYTYLQKRFL
jgi:hypothetical protein